MESIDQESSNQMTLREAADQTSRSITTLRRYIRSGRLRAEKRHGRYGPEYFVTAADLRSAGFELTDNLPAPRVISEESLIPTSFERSLTKIFSESIPVGVHQELLMKHEQLLVQYGMVRNAGVKLMDLQSDCDQLKAKIAEQTETIARLRAQLARETELLSQRLRQTELTLEGKRIENAQLREKISKLEILARNSITNETVESQVAEVFQQSRKVKNMSPDPPGSSHYDSNPRAHFVEKHPGNPDPGPDH